MRRETWSGSGCPLQPQRGTGRERQQQQRAGGWASCESRTRGGKNLVERLPTSAAPVEELDASHSSISSVPEERAAEAGSMSVKVRSGVAARQQRNSAEVPWYRAIEENRLVEE
jgi:hypothetical protein